MVWVGESWKRIEDLSPKLSTSTNGKSGRGTFCRRFPGDRYVDSK